MPTLAIRYGGEPRSLTVEQGSLLSEAILSVGLVLEQQCGRRGTCGQCRVLAEGEVNPVTAAERKHLSPAELAAGYRLACQARIAGDATVVLASPVIYSSKIFRSAPYPEEGRLGLAIDLGSTTVAALLVSIEDGRVCAGAAALNQQSVFGADIISRLAAAEEGPLQAARLSALAQASIAQAVRALELPRRAYRRIRRATIVGNCAMHHLLLRYPVSSLAALPFQPYAREAVRGASDLLHGILPATVEVDLPPLIGGFVGSDTLACLAAFGFERAPGPMAAIDLGTNGEVMVTDGRRILVASTAAGPAFEGVNISCGTRAVEGAVTGVRVDGASGNLMLTTIGSEPPVGLTGSGLLALVHGLRRAGAIASDGRFSVDHPAFAARFSQDEEGVRRFRLTPEGAARPLYLTQHDVRELQKAKAAVSAAAGVLLGRLGLEPGDLERLILTGSFGSQVDARAVVGLGMVPAVALERIETPANGAGLGAALFLHPEEFARGEHLARAAEQVDLDLDEGFNRRYIQALALP